MLSTDSSVVRQRDAPDWWATALHPGQDVDLQLYGETMCGRLQGITGNTFTVTIPISEQSPGLLSTAHGTAVIPMPDGAARLPVTCWASGNQVRMQVIGPVEFIQRRMHVRVALRLPISLGWLPPGTSSWCHVKSFTVDLSLGGTQIEPATVVWPDSGLPVQLRVSFPDGPWPAEAEAVGKTADYGLRLRFGELSPEALARITTLLS